jgi:hypothetical protein
MKLNDEMSSGHVRVGKTGLGRIVQYSDRGTQIRKFRVEQLSEEQSNEEGLNNGVYGEMRK